MPRPTQQIIGKMRTWLSRKYRLYTMRCNAALGILSCSAVVSILAPNFIPSVHGEIPILSASLRFVRESTILPVSASVLWNSLKNTFTPLPVKWHRCGKPRISTLIHKETMGFWHLFGEHIYPKVTNFQFPSPGWSCRSGVIDAPINFTKVLHQSRHVLTDGYTNKLVAGTY